MAKVIALRLIQNEVALGLDGVGVGGGAGAQGVALVIVVVVVVVALRGRVYLGQVV